jgi:thioredoxin-dependent peroxiredoxin
MAAITLKGNPTRTVGELPPTGAKAPAFAATKNDLSDVTLESYCGKTKVLNIVPSLDTGICAASARRFNQEASKLPNTVVLTISADLPFASARFCEANGIDRVETLSVFRHPTFGTDYGIQIADGPMAGLLGRAVIIVDENDTVTYTQLVPEIAQEPDYEAVLAALKG